MNKSGSDDSAPMEQENTKYAQADANVVYAASADDSSKYATAADGSKYAMADDNVKYAMADENAKYAMADENTKYAGGRGPGAAPNPLLRRRAVDSAVEEALMSVTSAVDRIHPNISGETRAQLTRSLVEMFGGELVEAHLGVTASDIGK